MSTFAALHYGAFGVGILLGAFMRFGRSRWGNVMHVFGVIGLILSFYVFSILRDPTGGTNAGGATDLFFIYTVMLFIPALIVLPLLVAGGWTLGRIGRHVFVGQDDPAQN